MSIDVKCEVRDGDLLRINGRDGSSRLEVGVRDGEWFGSAVVDRAEFLAAIKAECGVRCVPADAIVIERQELVRADRVDGSRILAADGTTLGFVGDGSMRTEALRLIAAAEYNESHPSFSDKDVETLADGLMRHIPVPHGIAYAACQEAARRLLASGKVTVTS
jgi:hypothetical protein